MNEDQEIKIGLTCSDDANNSGIPNSSGWDGTGLPPVGVDCELKYKHSTNAIWRKCKVFSYSNEYGVVAAVWHCNYGMWCHNTIDVIDYDFRKPETPEQREERERLEAAKDLVCAYWGVKTDAEPSPELLKAMLRIVDKTNYRLTK